MDAGGSLTGGMAAEVMNYRAKPYTDSMFHAGGPE